MSRIIIKNLPSYLTKTRLQTHLDDHGPKTKCTVTDVQLPLRKDGSSRRFAFVGYKTAEEAQAAKQWFDRSFIDSTKISVDIVEDGLKERPKKRQKIDHSLDNGSQPDGTKKDGIKEKAEKETKAKNSQMEEFVGLQMRKKGPSWADDLLPAPDPTSKLPLQESSAMEPAPDEGHGEPSDLEWLKQHMSKSVDTVEKAFEQSDNEDEPEKDEDDKVETPADTRTAKEKEKDAIKEVILQSGRLFVRNLTFSCTQDELTELFNPYGTVEKVHIPLSLEGTSKGLAYITYSSPSAAVAAYEALDGKAFQGRLLHLLGAVDKPGSDKASDKKRTVKGEKDIERKKAAGKEFNWGLLYMNPDAVASSISDRFGIPKSTILNPSEDSGSDVSAAVKLALAETHIINETKTYLASHGVILSSFQPSTSKQAPKGRSQTVILVKNIPYGTTESQLRELFGPFGQINRLLVPPAGTLAVVEYDQPQDADKAFKGMAYRRLGSSIVYLERAPLGLFDDSIPIPKKDDTDQVAQEEDPTPTDLSAGTTLYIKNLSFHTTSARLTSLFAGLPGFSFAKVQMKPSPDGKKELSMGYGFVGFKTKEEAAKALRGMQGVSVDGKELKVSFAGRGTDTDDVHLDSAKKKSSKGTKMIVKNVPFEATKKDIADLFGSHYPLKSIRLPKKPFGSSTSTHLKGHTRGFAFLEFLTTSDAENAFALMRHTHLLGRHLVLEWAEEGDQDIDVLREKVKAGLGTGGELPGRKRKLDFTGKRGGDGEDPELME